MAFAITSEGAEGRKPREITASEAEKRNFIEFEGRTGQELRERGDFRTIAILAQRNHSTSNGSSAASVGSGVGSVPVIMEGPEVTFLFQFGSVRDAVCVPANSLTLKTLKDLACDFINTKVRPGVNQSESFRLTSVQDSRTWTIFEREIAHKLYISKWFLLLQGTMYPLVLERYQRTSKLLKQQRSQRRSTSEAI